MAKKKTKRRYAKRSVAERVAFAVGVKLGCEMIVKPAADGNGYHIWRRNPKNETET